MGIQINVIGDLDGVACTELLSRCIRIVGEEPRILVPTFSRELLQHYNTFDSFNYFKLGPRENQQPVNFTQLGSLDLDKLTPSFGGPVSSLFKVCRNMLGGPIKSLALLEGSIVCVEDSIDSLCWFRRDTADSVGQAYRATEVRLTTENRQFFFSNLISNRENLR